MTYTTQQLQDEPIVIVTYGNPFDPNHDIPAVHHEISEVLKHMPGTLYRVIDTRTLEGTFATLVEALDQSSRGKVGGTADPRVRTILIGNHTLVVQFTEAMKQQQYGSFNIPLFSSVEDGIAYARTELNAGR